MNVSNTVTSLKQKYKHNETATEALKAGLAVSSTYITDLLSSLKVSVSNDQRTISILKTYTEILITTFNSILSNPTTTKEDLAEAKDIFRARLAELEELVKP